MNAMTRQEIQELVSRGLDADLNRNEMRQLYRLVVEDKEIHREIAELLAVEEEMLLLNDTFSTASLPDDFIQRVDQALNEQASAASGIANSAQEVSDETRPTLGERFFSWLRSPHGVSFQPLSLGVGALAALALGFIILLPGQSVPSAAVAPRLASAVQPISMVSAPRFNVLDLPLIQAKARVDWHNRFIIMPGKETRLDLQTGGNRPAYLRFESGEAATLVVRHRGPETAVDSVSSFVVEGVSYATLKQPRRGDAVMVRNNSLVPVMVYLHSLGSGGASITSLSAAQSATKQEKAELRKSRI